MQIPVPIPVPVAIKLRPVVKTPEPQSAIANLPIGRLLKISSLKFLVRNFCILWLKLNLE